MKLFTVGVTVLCIGVLLFVLGILFISNVDWFMVDLFVSAAIIMTGGCILIYSINKDLADASKK